MKDLQKIFADYLNLTKGDDFDLDKFNQYSIVFHSNAIEGSTLTKEETFLLLDEQLTPKNRPLEHVLMARDIHEALKFAIFLAISKKPLNEHLIKKM